MNVLAVGAHYDDIELGCSGSLAKHVRAGDSVILYTATDSEYFDPKGRKIRSGETAKREAEQAAEIIGAELIKGACSSLFLNFEEKINAELVKVIEERKIDLIYTHWTGDIQHDHINLGRASVHAGRHVPRILMYQSNWYESEAPFKKNFYVDISDFWHIKEKAIRVYKSEMERTGAAWIEYFKAQARCNGLQTGVQYAEAFHAVRWLM